MVATRIWAALGMGVVFIAALGGRARGDAASIPGPDSELSLEPSRALLAEATWALEGAFADQFVRNEVDPAALSGPIDEVIRAMPEAMRPQVQQHIEEVVRIGQALAPQMSPEQRASVAAAPAPEAVDSTEQALIRHWGWDGYRGWGGVGAFAFPISYDRKPSSYDRKPSADSGPVLRCRGFDPQCFIIPLNLCLAMTRCHPVPVR